MVGRHSVRVNLGALGVGSWDLPASTIGAGTKLHGAGYHRRPSRNPASARTARSSRLGRHILVRTGERGRIFGGVFHVNAFCRGRLLDQRHANAPLDFGSDRSRCEPAAAVGTDVRQDGLDRIRSSAVVGACMSSLLAEYRGVSVTRNARATQLPVGIFRHRETDLDGNSRHSFLPIVYGVTGCRSWARAHDRATAHDDGRQRDTRCHHDVHRSDSGEAELPVEFHGGQR